MPPDAAAYSWFEATDCQAVAGRLISFSIRPFLDGVVAGQTRFSLSIFPIVDYHAMTHMPDFISEHQQWKQGEGLRGLGGVRWGAVRRCGSRHPGCDQPGYTGRPRGAIFRDAVSAAAGAAAGVDGRCLLPFDNVVLVFRNGYIDSGLQNCATVIAQLPALPGESWVL